MTVPVSVVVPFYQGHATIQRALDSLARQTQRPLEVVVVDDGSDPPFEAPAAAAGELAVRVIRHAANRGIPAARNTGIAHARGEWIAFLDQDDVWAPEKLERQWRIAGAAGRAEKIVIYGRCRFEGDGFEPSGAVIPRPRSMRRLARGGEAAVRELLSRGNLVPFIGILVRRAVFDEIEPLDERLTGGSDDAEMILRMAAAGYLFESSDGPEEHSLIHYYTGSNYSDPDRWTRDEELYLPELAARYPWVRAYERRAWFRIRYRNARYHHRAGRRGAARAEYRRAAGLRPLDPRPWLGRLACSLPARLDRIIARGWEPVRARLRTDR